MKKPKHHIFVCGSFRANGTPQGVCNKKNSMGLLQYLEQELSDRGLIRMSSYRARAVSKSATGPAMVVYPENWWYGGVEGTSAIDDILDALEEGRPAEKYYTYLIQLTHKRTSRCRIAKGRSGVT